MGFMSTAPPILRVVWLVIHRLSRGWQSAVPVTAVLLCCIVDANRCAQGWTLCYNSKRLALVQAVWFDTKASGVMEDRRPVNLEIATLKLPITAWVSIMHRISGIGLFFGSAVLLWALYYSLDSVAGYNQVRGLLVDTLAGRLLLWAVLVALAYHSCAGLRHLLMDFGYGETLDSGVRGAQMVLAASGLLALLSAWWLF